MARNTDREIKDFIIESGIKAVLADTKCEVRYNRSAMDFVEYLKWVPFRFNESGKIDFRQMVVDYFSSSDKHYFEIVREIDRLVAEEEKLKADLS